MSQSLTYFPKHLSFIKPINRYSMLHLTRSHSSHDFGLHATIDKPKKKFNLYSDDDKVFDYKYFLEPKDFCIKHLKLDIIPLSKQGIETALSGIDAFLEHKINIKNSSDYDETTEYDDVRQQKTHLKTKIISDNYAYWGQPPKNKDAYASKIYRKGFTDENEQLFLGIKIVVSSKSNDKNNPYARKGWTGLHKKYHSLNIPNKNKNIGLHRSHALANCFFGPETGANIAIATTGKKDFLGQGEAQGLLETAILDIFKSPAYVALHNAHKENECDLRIKITDYCDDNNLLLKRRIKIFANDVSSKTNKQEYPEIMLGEFYFDGNLILIKNGQSYGELKDAIKKFTNNCSHYMNIIKDNDNPDARNQDFWEAHHFLVRNNVLQSLMPTADAQEDPTRPQESIDALKEGKKNRTDDALNPILFFENKPKVQEDNLGQELKEAYDALDIHEKTEIHDELRHINLLISNFQNSSVDKGHIETQIFNNIHTLFKTLKEKKILSAKNIRQFFPKKVNHDNKRIAIPLQITPTSELIMALLRMAD